VPVIVDPAVLAGYGSFPSSIDRDWLGRVTHLSAGGRRARRRTDPATQLGFAVQLATIRAVGMVVPDLTQVPAPFVTAVADQLLIDDPMPLLDGYARAPVRWRHAGEIRVRYGYHGFSGVARWLFTKWLYRQAWDDDPSATMLFRAAHHQLLVRRILLPGHSVLARLIATVRERASARLHARLIEATPAEVRARLEKLLLVVQGGRYSELDLLRRPPFTPTIGGLVKALDRLMTVRALGAGDLDLSTVPARRVAALARYADQAWATQLADLGPARRVATLVAYLHLLTATAGDDVLDIFDVVFGDLQRAATHRGQKRRVGELRVYDQAVAALHARMRSVLDALGDGPALTRVLESLRTERTEVQQHMDTVEALMRPLGDPFHERLVASYPQIRRFLPLFIDAFDLASIPAAARRC
jgi:hypothetical protein